MTDDVSNGADGALELGPVGRAPSRTDLVAETIRIAILEGRLAPGTTLVERRLAASLGVSKTPVREALIRLNRSGLVEMTPNRGAVVGSLDAASLREVYEVRLRLEPWAIRRSVELAAVEIYEPARTALDEAAAAAAEGAHARASLANREFHRALYSRCGNSIVKEILDNQQDRVALGTVSLLWARAPTWGEEAEQHRAILDAVRDGNAELAERRAGEHLTYSLGTIPEPSPSSDAGTPSPEAAASTAAR